MTPLFHRLRALMGGFTVDPSAVKQVALGATVAGTPVWVTAVQGYAAMIAAVCGAVIGIAGVIRMFKKKPVNSERGE